MRPNFILYGKIIGIICLSGIIFSSFISENESLEATPETKNTWGGNTLRGEPQKQENDAWCAFACLQYFSTKTISQCQLATDYVDVPYISCCAPPIENDNLPDYAEYIANYNKCFAGILSTEFVSFASEYDPKIIGYIGTVNATLELGGSFNLIGFPCYLFMQDMYGSGHCVIFTGITVDIYNNKKGTIYYWDPANGEMQSLSSDSEGDFGMNLYIIDRRRF